MPYVFNANTGKIIFRIPEVEASMKKMLWFFFTCCLLDFTSTKFMLECEWYITTSDQSAVDNVTAPVDLWPYWSFKNVKLQCGSGGPITVEVLTTFMCTRCSIEVLGVRIALRPEKLCDFDGEIVGNCQECNFAHCRFLYR